MMMITPGKKITKQEGRKERNDRKPDKGKNQNKKMNEQGTRRRRATRTK